MTEPPWTDAAGLAEGVSDLAEDVSDPAEDVSDPDEDVSDPDEDAPDLAEADIGWPGMADPCA